MRMQNSSLLHSTWHELRRRRVTRVGAVYAVVVWLVLQIAEITFDPLGLPGWALTWTVLVAVLGFPVALVLAWFFEVSPSGLVRERGVGPAVGRVFAVLLVLFTVGGTGWWLSEVYAPQRAELGGANAPAPEVAVNTVAVLPFDDMSEGRDQGHLGDGIAEELLDRLARLPGLRVAARTSSFALRDFAGGVAELGNLLRVRWVLEGSVRRAGNRVRVTAQLIDAADGYHAWSETYERSADDLFALQDEVTAAIAIELRRRIPAVRAGSSDGAAAAAALSPSTATADSEALQLYLRGRQAWRLRSPASLREAEQLFLQATAVDPEYSRAWSGLADTYLLQADYDLRPVTEAIALAETAAVRALSLDPALGEAWASLGLLRSMAGQLRPARRSLEEAMRLDPRYEMAPMWLAGVLGMQGEFSAQRRVLEQAHDLNPLEPVINSNLAGLLAGRGEVEQARALLERVLAITPNEPLVLRTLAKIELVQAELLRALELARRALAADPEAPASIAMLIEVLATLEAFDEAVALLASLPAGTNRLTLAQSLQLRRGNAGLVPTLRELSEQLLDSRAPLTYQDRELLVLAGSAYLRGGDADAAARLLQRVVGEATALESSGGRLIDAASMLAVALQRNGSAAALASLQQALGEAAHALLDSMPSGANPDTEFGRALLATFEQRPADALAALETAYQVGFRQRWLLLYDPRLAPLRDSPGLQALADRIGDELARIRTSAGLAG